MKHGTILQNMYQPSYERLSDWEVPSAEPCRECKWISDEETIKILSDLRAKYNCFELDEERYYRALSHAIDVVSRGVSQNESNAILVVNQE